MRSNIVVRRESEVISEFVLTSKRYLGVSLNTYTRSIVTEYLPRHKHNQYANISRRESVLSGSL